MMYDPYETQRYVWAIRTLNPKVERDKKSISHANAGIGYYIISAPETGRSYYIVAFKHFGGLLQNGAELANPHQVEKLEQMDNYRYGGKSDK